MLSSIKRFFRWLGGPVPKEEVVWVVNDIGEIGVRINGVSYFMYKGESIVYSELHEDGSPMMQRIVGKRECGETLHVPGLEGRSDGNACYFEGDGWFPLTEADPGTSIYPSLAARAA